MGAGPSSEVQPTNPAPEEQATTNPAPAEQTTAEQATEEPTAEEQATEDVGPLGEEQATEEQATEQPATEAPATEAPATEAPATEAPPTEAPPTEAPATKARAWHILTVALIASMAIAVAFIVLYATNDPQPQSAADLTPSERWNTLTPDEKWAITSTDLIAAIWKVVNSSDGTLGIGEELKAEMLGLCLNASDYEPAPRDEQWQCQENDQFNFWTAADVANQTPASSAARTWYQPDDGVQFSLAAFAQTPIDGIKELIIKSGLSNDGMTDDDLDKTKGTWCAMPAPLPQFSNDFPVVQYWNKCVLPNSGFFNLLKCDGGKTNNGTNKAYAVLGVAALNPGVCYPSHQHAAAEAYWQIGGGTTWRVWSDNCTENGGPLPAPGSGANAKCTQTGAMHSIDDEWTTSEYGGGVETDPDKWRDANGSYARAKPHLHPGWLVHEMDTSLSTGSGQLTLLIYFWGLPKEPFLYPKNDYQSGLGQWTGLNSTSNATEQLVIRQARGSCASPKYVPTPEQVSSGEAEVTCPR